jgi:hypothetical protein
MRSVLALALIAVTLPLSAQQPLARARLDPGSLVTVGQPLTVIVEVLVPSFFSGAPRFPDLDIPNAITVFPDRGTNFTERIDRSTWAGQSRRYTIYPMRAGSYEISDIPVEVRYFAPGVGPRATATVSPPPVRFDAYVPPQAEGLDYFIATSRLTMQESFDRRPDTVLVGEAFTRTITFTVRDALSMVIPPMTFDTVPGLGVYVDPPVVEDTGGERGQAIVGTRVESVTYVAQEEGDYQLPAVELAWWDIGAGRLRRAALPAVDFHVAPNPALLAEIPLPPDSVVEAALPAARTRISLMSLLRRWFIPIAAALVIMVILVRLVRRHGSRVRERVAALRRRHAESERSYFRRFCRAARKGDPRAAARHVMFWLDRRSKRGEAATFSTFAGEAADPALDREAESLGARLYAPADSLAQPWSGSRFAATVAKGRKRSTRGVRGSGDGGSLNLLNPTG